MSDWIEEIDGFKDFLRKDLKVFNAEISKYLDTYAKQNVCNMELFNFKIKSPISNIQSSLNIFKFTQRIDVFYFKLCCAQAVSQIMKKKIEEDRKFCKLEPSNLFKLKYSYQFFANAEYMFYNLSSSLDILSHVLNDVYALGMAKKDVDFNKLIKQLKEKSVKNRVLKYCQKNETEFNETSQKSSLRLD